jgi:hydroxymethylpyrimidine/phosphomethylpyrimidine kinase
MRSDERRCALAIGGLDPGGGAGILADLRAFARARVFGCAAVALLTVQSTAGLRRARALAARDVALQAEEVIAHQRVRAIKVGALGSVPNVRAVAHLLAAHPDIPAVVDTPIRPTRGRARLLAADAVAPLRAVLLPRATLVTVNVPEAELLAGRRIRSVEEARDAARALADLGPKAVLIKGGHLEGPEAIDVLAVGGALVELRARRLALPPMHGSGCTLASLIAGRLAHAPRSRGGVRPSAIVAATRWAKRAHHAALARAESVGAGARIVAF